MVNLSFKVTSGIFLVSVILFSIFTYYHVEDHRDILGEGYVDKAESIAYALDAGIETKDDLKDKSKLLSNIHKIIWLEPDILMISISVPHQDGLITVVSNEQYMIGELLDEDNLRSYRDNILIKKFVMSRGLRSKVLRVITPIHVSGQQAGTYQIDLTLENMDKAIKKEINNFIVSISLSIILFIIIIFFILRATVLKPISEINKGVNAIAKGDFDYKIRVRSNDELGDLSNSFTKMTSDLRISQLTLKSHERELETLVERRTKELNKKVKELEEARTATLNILEDVNLSKDDLEKSHKELVALNKVLEDANVELERMDEYKNEFISMTAHELKTPLASIHGFANLLQNKKILSDPKQRDYYLNIIMQDAERLKTLVDDILDISRLDLGTMKFVFEKVNLKDVFKELVKELYLLAAKKGLTLKANVANNVASVLITDKSRLTQILVNLVNNSIKYTPKKGGRITVTASKSKGNVLFSVKDIFIGIQKKSISKVFDRFYQADSSYTRKVGGAGLGLAICKGIIEAQKGKIWIKSKMGKGTTFFFTLPIKSKEPLKEEKDLQVIKSEKPKAKNIKKKK